MTEHDFGPPALIVHAGPTSGKTHLGKDRLFGPMMLDTDDWMDKKHADVWDQRKLPPSERTAEWDEAIKRTGEAFANWPGIVVTNLRDRAFWAQMPRRPDLTVFPTPSEIVLRSSDRPRPINLKTARSWYADWMKDWPFVPKYLLRHGAYLEDALHDWLDADALRRPREGEVRAVDQVLRMLEHPPRRPW